MRMSVFMRQDKGGASGPVDDPRLMTLSAYSHFDSARLKAT